MAIIDFIDGSKAYTVLGNIDSFLTKLEKEQRDLVSLYRCNSLLDLIYN